MDKDVPTHGSRPTPPAHPFDQQAPLAELTSTTQVLSSPRARHIERQAPDEAPGRVLSRSSYPSTATVRPRHGGQQHPHATEKPTRETPMAPRAALRAWEGQSPLGENADDLLHAVVRAERAACVGQALAKLPADERRALELRYVDGRSVRAGGLLMGVSPVTFDRLHFRGLRRLRVLLAADERLDKPAAVAARAVG